MANKGVNTIILEGKKEILNAVNGCLEKGVPISVVQLIMENLMFEINNSLNDTIAKEDVKYQEQLKVEDEQIEYIEPQIVANGEVIEQ